MAPLKGSWEMGPRRGGGNGSTLPFSLVLFLTLHFQLLGSWPPEAAFVSEYIDCLSLLLSSLCHPLSTATSSLTTGLLLSLLLLLVLVLLGASYWHRARLRQRLCQLKGSGCQYRYEHPFPAVTSFG